MNHTETHTCANPTDLVELLWEDHSGKSLLVVSIPPDWAGLKITLDDFNFHFQEGVSPDEMAQDIFTLTGGLLDQHGSCGTSKHLRIYYDSQWHGQLALELKHESLLTDGLAWLPRITGNEPAATTATQSSQDGVENSA
jgi:hypothetical protein